MKTKIFLATAFLLSSVFAYGAWLKNVPQSLIQPDGNRLELFATGDEFHNWLHDKNNFTVIQDPETGYFTYADLYQGELVPTPWIPGVDNPAFKGLRPGINISQEKYQLLRQEKFKGTSRKSATAANNIGTLNNIVIFIRFQYQSEYTESASYYDNSFNGSNMVSMNTYFGEVSANQLAINTAFYPSFSGSSVVSYQDSHPRNYYMPYNSVTNPSGYQGNSQLIAREHLLLKNATESVKSQIESSGLDFDWDNDGYVDNICYIIQGQTAGWSDLLWPHMWELFNETVYINGARVKIYNFQLSDAFGVSVLCHEMFHSLGAPDLYRYENDNIDPVGTWDLMNWNRNPPQHMTVHMKQKYGGWLNNIPEISSTGTYTLEPLAENPFAAYKIPSPNSSSEFFVVEYRRAIGQFESSLPGSGLIIYRVNPSLEGNAQGPPDELYVYRPGGTSSRDGDLDRAFFSSGAGRTQFNDNTDPSCFLSNGAAGGIKIKNISSAGTTISFELEAENNFQPPRNLTASVSSSNVGLNWQKPSTGTGTLTGYKLFRNNVQITSISNPNTLSYNDTNLASGTYTYYLTASYSNPSGTSGASNQVSVEIGQSGQPDLVITEANVTPNTVDPGGTINIGCHLENNGSAEAGESMLRLYISSNQTLDGNDTQIAHGSMGSISPGYYINVSGEDLEIPSGLAGGTYYVLFVADADADVSESNENNNLTAVALSIGSAALNPPTNLQAQVTGSNVLLSWTLPSSSGASLSGYKVYRNGNLLGSISDPGTSQVSDNGLSPGTYSYYLTAVYSSPSGESSASNTVSVTISTQTLPDLTILDPSVTPAEVDPGQEVNLACKYSNRGEATAGASRLGIYVSLDRELDASDVLFAYGEFDPLEAGYYYNVTGNNVALPESLSAGTWYVLYVADDQEQVAESSENNNIGFVEITVAGAELNPPRNLTASVNGKNVLLSWNPPAATDAVLEGYTVYRNNAAIGQTGAQIVSFTDSNRPPGTYTYKLTARYSDPAGESVPSNTVEVTVEDVSNADLIITNASATPTQLDAGGDVSVACKLSNIGGLASGESWLRLYFSTDQIPDANDTQIASGQMDALDPGMYISITGDNLSIPSGLAPGIYYLVFVADADDEVAESNENNNVATVQIQVGSFDLNPPQHLSGVISGSDIQLSWDSPEATAAVLQYYRIFRNGNQLTQLGPGTTTYTDSGLAYGTYSYYVKAVYSNPSGLSVASNTIELTLSANTKPDLTISDSRVQPMVVDPGSDISISCKLHNTGTAEAGSSMMRLFLSQNTSYDAGDISLAYGTMDPLAAGSSRNVEGQDLMIPKDLTPGSWFVLFIADADGEVSESNENNNMEYVSLTVASQLPDLRVTEMYLLPSTITQGGQMRVSASFTNSGLNVTGNCEAFYFASHDALLDPSDIYLNKVSVKRLFVNEKVAVNNYVQIPANFGIGNKFLIIKVDGGGIIQESNEENNSMASPFTIGGTGIEEYEDLARFDLYPNPTNDYLNLNLSTKNPGRIILEIQNALGQVLIREDHTIDQSLNKSWDTRSWAKGIYFMHLRTKSELTTKRFIVN